MIFYDLLHILVLHHKCHSANIILYGQFAYLDFLRRLFAFSNVVVMYV